MKIFKIVLNLFLMIFGAFVITSCGSSDDEITNTFLDEIVIPKNVNDTFNVPCSINDNTIYWSTNKNDYVKISENGIIDTIKSYKDVNIKLTALAYINNKAVERSFKRTIKKLNNTEAIDLALNDIRIFDKEILPGSIELLEKYDLFTDEIKYAYSLEDKCENAYIGENYLDLNYDENGINVNVTAILGNESANKSYLIKMIKSKCNYDVPEELDTNSHITIKFYHTMGDSLQKVLAEAINEFERDYRNISVEASQIGGYDDVRNQLVTDIPNGKEPNLAYCYPDHIALYNRSGAVVQLDNLIEDENFGYNGDVSDFVPGFYEEGKMFGDGHMYSLPFSKSTEVLYYNKTAFTREGWAVPTTWEEMATLCAKIKEKYPSSTPLGIDSESNLFINISKEIGSRYTSAIGEHYLFDNDENKAFVGKFKEWYDKGYFTTQKIINAYTSTLFIKTGSDQPTYDGSFMSIGSTGGASHQYDKSFECGVAAMPSYGNVDLKVTSQGPSLCIFNKENPQEVLATWLFVKNYLLTSVFQAKFSMKSGYNPVLKSTSAIPDYAKWINEANGKSSDGVKALAAKASNEMVNNYYTSPAFVGSSTARDQVGQLFVNVMTGRKDIDKAFKDAIDACRC